jgi:hypothetical protein
MVRSLAISFALLLAAAVIAWGQGMKSGETIGLNAASDTLLLSHDFIVPGTLRLQLDSAYILQPQLDYTIDHRFGILSLTPFFRRLLVDTTRSHRLSVEYNFRPINLQREYSRRQLVTLTDSTGAKRQVAQERGGLTAASIFGKDFQRSGSVVRGFTIGSNRDLSLQSGFRLQFSGKITDDVEVLGALTDEQTPIQPEGNTQTLREVDNIFIEFRSPHVGSTVGKFTASNSTSEFTSFSRKLQGVKAIGRYGSSGSTEVIAAVSPGKFRTQQMQGIERNQGPYRLTGPNGERTIIVIAGTEKVFIDGVEMTRGDNNDYVIDYSTAEIFFQTRRPITSASRITVDFEYTDQQYSRSFVAMTSTQSLFDGALSLTGNYLREADNPDATIDISLSDSDRALLAAAGGDQNRAVRSGVYLVGPTDTLRSRLYYLDTVIVDGRVDTFYVYAPNDPRSLYNVVFSVAPDGRGDYVNESFGRYRYVGKGLGVYLPVVYLPLPQLRQIGSLKLAARPVTGVEISGEIAYSDASLNRLSLAPGAHQSGMAFRAAASARTDSLRIGGTNLGAIAFSGSASSLAAQFRPSDRIGDVEFNNKWNTSSLYGQSGYDEFKAEGVLSYLPTRRLELATAPGYLRRRGIFESLRQLYAIRFLGDTSLPSAQDTLEVITTSDTSIGGSRGQWLKHHGGASYRFGAFIPGVRFSYERREDRGAALTDTLYPSSFGYIEAGPDLQINLPFLTATATARYRIDDSVRYDRSAGRSRFFRDGASQTYSVNGRLTGVKNLSSTLELTYRNKSYDSIPLANIFGRLNNNTLLVRSQTRWSGFDRGADLDALYEVQTEQTSRLQRVFIQVQRGTGQYIWEDRDSNGIQEPNEFRLTNAAETGEGNYVLIDYPTEQLFPIIDLRASARVRLEPKRLINTESGLGKLLAPVTSETYMRVEEKSQTGRESDIYLLRLGRFQDDSTTLAGIALLQQDLNLFDLNPEYSFRLRYLGRRGLTRLVNAIERSNSFERSLRAQWHPTLDIGLQLDLASTSSLLTSTDTTSTRTFDLTTLSATNDFSYRPEQSLELGWKLHVAQSEDILPATPRTALVSSNAIRAVYSIETHGRIRAEIERTNVSSSDTLNTLSLPYQFTEGYGVGVTWAGRIGVDYRFGANIQLSINYNGRAQPPSNVVVHTGTAEIRAFF